MAKPMMTRPPLQDNRENGRPGRFPNGSRDDKRDDKRQDKRQRILDAAVQVFSQKGFFAARVSDVAATAGIADGTVYLYFKSKDDILISLFDGVMAQQVAAAREEVAQASGAPAKLRAIANHHLGLLGGNPQLAVVFQVELRQSTKFMELFTASWLTGYFDLVEESIEVGQEEGTIRADLPRKLATHAFFGALDALVTSWVLSHNSFDLRAMAEPAVDLFLAGATARKGQLGAVRPPRGAGKRGAGKRATGDGIPTSVTATRVAKAARRRS